MLDFVVDDMDPRVSLCDTPPSKKLLISEGDSLLFVSETRKQKIKYQYINTKIKLLKKKIKEYLKNSFKACL